MGSGGNNSPGESRESEIKENYYYGYGRCRYCNALLIVMRTQTGSVIPVEVKDKKSPVSLDEEFHSSKYNSHLKNCERLAEKWKPGSPVKEHWIKKLYPELKGKDLLK